MAAAHKGRFIPKNPAKYIASNIHNITHRSSWELSLFQLLDNHPMVLGWASEAVKIPYKNPLTNKNTLYVPDVFVVYVDRSNIEHKELIEVKPMQEVPGYKGKVSKLVESRQIVNMMKWKAAVAFCTSRGWKFRVATEADMFAFKGKTRV
jgi:hypothetical protein